MLNRIVIDSPGLITVSNFVSFHILGDFMVRFRSLKVERYPAAPVPFSIFDKSQ